MASERPALAVVPREPIQEPPRAPGRPVAQVRGVLAERVIVSTELDPFFTLKALARYSGCSVRWLHARLTDPAHPLPHYRPGGKLLVRRSEFDAWIAQYRRSGTPDIDRVVRDVMAGLGQRDRALAVLSGV